MSKLVDSDVKGWFLDHSLLWTDEIDKDLSGKGIECVEDLKLLPPEVFYDLFKAGSFTVKEKAKHAHRELMKEKFEFAKCNKHIPTKDNIRAPPSSSKAPVKSHNHKMNMNNMGADLTSFPHFSRKVTKTAEEKKADRELRKKQKMCTDLIAVDSDAEDSATTPANSSRPAGTTTSHGPLLALPPSDWRIGRCSRAKELNDIADGDERICWGEHGLSDKTYLDLEDPEGYYALLVCSKESSDDEVFHKWIQANTSTTGLPRKITRTRPTMTMTRLQFTNVPRAGTRVRRKHLKS